MSQVSRLCDITVQMATRMKRVQRQSRSILLSGRRPKAAAAATATELPSMFFWAKTPCHAPALSGSNRPESMPYRGRKTATITLAAKRMVSDQTSMREKSARDRRSTMKHANRNIHTAVETGRSAIL